MGDIYVFTKGAFLSTAIQLTRRHHCNSCIAAYAGTNHPHSSHSTSTMKLNTSLLLSIGHLAAVGHALDIRSEFETECYSFDAVKETNLQFNSYSACLEECHGEDAGNLVFALRGPGCMCLDSLPPADKKVDASECNELCPGYMKHICELYLCKSDDHFERCR